MKTFTPTQSLACQILEGVFLGYDVSKKNGWKFAVRRSYFYAPASRLEGFVANVEKALLEVPGVKLLSTDDHYDVWPKLSYYEAIILVEDTAAFFQGPAPKEEAPAPEPEAVEEVPAAPAPEPVTNLFNLANTFADRKSWRRAIRNLAAELNAPYTNENGCYYLVLEDGTYEFSFTDDRRALVVLLPADIKVLNDEDPLTFGDELSGEFNPE